MSSGSIEHRRYKHLTRIAIVSVEPAFTYLTSLYLPSLPLHTRRQFQLESPEVCSRAGTIIIKAGVYLCFI